MNTTTIKPRRKPRQPFANKERRLRKARAFALSDDYDPFDQFQRWFHDRRAFSLAEQTPYIWRLLLAEYRKASHEKYMAECAAYRASALQHEPTERSTTHVDALAR
jgi:hypothetical protein